MEQEQVSQQKQQSIANSYINAENESGGGASLPPPPFQATIGATVQRSVAPQTTPPVRNNDPHHLTNESEELPTYQFQQKSSYSPPNFQHALSHQNKGTAIQKKTNNATSSMASPSSPQVLQMAVGKGTAVEVGSQGLKISLSVTPEMTVKSGYAEITFGAPVTAFGHLKPKKEESSNTSVGGDGDSVEFKQSAEIYKKPARAAAQSKLSELAAQDLNTAGYEIVSAELEGSVGESSKESKRDNSVGIALKIKFQNGNEQTFQISLWQLAGGKSSWVNLGAEHQFNIEPKQVWQNKDYECILGGDIKAAVKIKPNWTKIIANLASRAALKEIGKRLLPHMLGTGGFLAIGAVQIFALIKSLESIGSIEQCAKLAVAAKKSFVCGYCTAMGVEDYGTGKETDWFSNGIQSGRKDLQKQIDKILSHPLFKQYNFTNDELRVQMKEKLSQHPAAVYNHIEPSAKDKIYYEYAQSYYDKREDEWSTPEHMAFQDTKWVCRRLGISEKRIKRKIEKED